MLGSSGCDKTLLFILNDMCGHQQRTLSTVKGVKTGRLLDSLGKRWAESRLAVEEWTSDCAWS